MNREIDYGIQLDFKAVFRTVVCYVPVFVINALAAVIRTRRSSAVNLLKAENAGEKPPRSNWLLAILGVVILGVAYWMALSISNAEHQEPVGRTHVVFRGAAPGVHAAAGFRRYASCLRLSYDPQDAPAVRPYGHRPVHSNHADQLCRVRGVLLDRVSHNVRCVLPDHKRKRKCHSLMAEKGSNSFNAV